MILKSFLFSSLSFSMRIINSVVVVGLYYGFMTTFSIGPRSSGLEGMVSTTCLIDYML